MTEQIMTTYVLTPKFNFDTGKFEFVNQKNRAVTLQFLPQSLDMRGGIDKRNYDYLQADLLSPNNPGYLEIINPLLMFPKGFLSSSHASLNGWVGDPFYSDAYVAIQGNTRLKLIFDVIAYIENVWSAINSESIPFEDKIKQFEGGFDRCAELVRNDSYNLQELYDNIRGVKPITISVLSDERASDWAFIMWLQRAANDAVKTQTVIQNAKAALNYYQFLTDENEKKAKANQQSRKEIITQAMKPFGLQITRFYHYQTIFSDSSPEWLQGAVEAGTLSLDTAITFLNSFKNLVDEYASKNKALVTKVEHFYDNVRDVAELDRKTDAALKIVPSHVSKAKQALLDAIVPDETPTVVADDVDSEQGSDTEGKGEGEGATDKQPDLKMTSDEYTAAIDENILGLLDKLMALQSGEASLFTVDSEGSPSPRYTEGTLKKLHKAVSNLAELLCLDEQNSFTQLVTVAQQAASEAIKKAQKEASKAELQVSVSPDQVEQANAMLQDLISV